MSSNRLVTLTGSGGVGKTRIAIEVARTLFGNRFPEVRFANLAPIALRLKTRSLLLILDNCEHVIKAADAVLAILHTRPNVTVLTTSRERLRLAGEHLNRLPSLPVSEGTPETIEDACTFASLQLLSNGRGRAAGTCRRAPPR